MHPDNRESEEGDSLFFLQGLKDPWIYHVRSRASLVRLNKEH